MTCNVAALILAAGAGSRIGVPKLKLEIVGRTFLSRIVAGLKEAGVGEIVCVVRPADREWINSADLGLIVVPNARPERGMTSSLYCGLTELPAADGIMVVAVDHPLVQTATYVELLGAFRRSPRSIVKPVYRGRPGHPLVIPRRLAALVPAEDLPGGLAALIARSRLEQVLVEVEDEGVIRNVNTRADLASLQMESNHDGKLS